MNKVRLRPLLSCLLLAGAAPVLASSAPADAATPAADAAPAWARHAEQLARQAVGTALGASATRSPPRVEVELGRLDPRLRLAPCARVDVYLPAGHRAWGSTRLGLRCVDGPTRWNVFLPVTVRVFAPAVQAARALPAGTVLAAEHLRLDESDWAAGGDSPAFRDTAQLLGRTLQRPVEAGGTLREGDLKRRQWFAVGDIVRIVVAGAGFAVTADGVALTPGIEGQAARVRTEGGRVVSGIATAERRVEVSL